MAASDESHGIVNNRSAVTGDYNTALQAFTINPMIRSGKTAQRIMDELFIAHKDHLPNFKETIERLEKKASKCKMK